jgi:hypothetical protein
LTELRSQQQQQAKANNDDVIEDESEFNVALLLRQN